MLVQKSSVLRHYDKLINKPKKSRLTVSLNELCFLYNNPKRYVIVRYMHSQFINSVRDFMLVKRYAKRSIRTNTIWIADFIRFH